jgi:hypothetical protein
MGTGKLARLGGACPFGATDRRTHGLLPRMRVCGTLDLYARVKGVLTVLDWKTGKAIYPEAFLQNVAYRHAAQRLGMRSAQGLIVRLPKLLDDPAWEVMAVPENLGLPDFQAALRLWRWQRHMEGRRIGSTSPPTSAAAEQETVPHGS